MMWGRQFIAMLGRTAPPRQAAAGHQSFMREEKMHMFLLLVGLIVFGSPAIAQEKQNLSSTDVERRTALFFKAPGDLLEKVLPQGWKLSAPIAGPSKDFNLGVTLISQLVTQAPDGKALPPRTYIVF